MGRSVIVGDVHGCSAELEDLLEHVGFGSGDRLWFVGDLVARGPDSRGVLRRVRELGAHSVIGNHEQRLLGAREARRRGEPEPHLNRSHQRVFAEFDDGDWELLASLPLYIDLPEHRLRIVHAGLVPGVPIEQQDPWAVTHIRSIDAEGRPSSRWGPTLWGQLYRGAPHVVFGHNAGRYPRLHPDATGLDTGCVYGGALTALVLDSGQAPPPPSDRQQALVSVPARREYAEFAGGLGG
jgi:Calcineurin-like phosphoesterase